MFKKTWISKPCLKHVTLQCECMSSDQLKAFTEKDWSIWGKKFCVQIGCRSKLQSQVFPRFLICQPVLHILNLLFQNYRSQFKKKILPLLSYTYNLLLCFRRDPWLIYLQSVFFPHTLIPYQARCLWNVKALAYTSHNLKTVSFCSIAAMNTSLWML